MITGNKQNKIISLLFLAIMVASNLVPLKALAIDTAFYSSNDILFYNPDDSCDTTGGSSGATGTDTTSTGSTGSIPYKLPATSGKTGYEESINSSGHIPSGGSVAFSKHASKGKAWQDYYITMRWTWTKWNWNGTNSGVEDSKQLSWMNKAPRIVLVTNQRTGKSIYAAALESGPAPWTGAKGGKGGASQNGWSNPQDGTPDKYTGRVSGFPPRAIEALGAKQGMSGGSGDILTYEWATDQSVTPGPTGDTAKESSSGECNSGTKDSNSKGTIYITTVGLRSGREAPPPYTNGFKADVRNVPDPSEGNSGKGFDPGNIKKVLATKEAKTHLSIMELEWAPKFKDGDKILIGCSAGYTRSVVIANEFGKRMAAQGWTVSITHRDYEKSGLKLPVPNPNILRPTGGGGGTVTIETFGFKFGDQPSGMQYVADVRDIDTDKYGFGFKPTENGFANSSPRPAEKIRSLVMSIPKAQEWLKTFQDKWAPTLRDGSKIAIGCSRGHHRSVSLAVTFGEWLKSKSWKVTYVHRDISKTW